MTQLFVTNPLTGRPIKIGGAVFNQLIFETHDFINGELVRRSTALPIPPREYYYNIVTRRRIIGGSRRYHELINNNWSIRNNYYLIPPWINTNITSNFTSPFASTERSIGQDISYERIMNRHRDTLNNLNITLCKECFLPIKIEDAIGDYCNECRPE